MGLSKVVASVAVVPAALWWTLRPYVPLPVSYIFLHVAATGFIVAAAASDPMARRTQGLLGKRESGKISLWGKVLFWPYHVGIRIRHQVRRIISSEPTYHEIYPGWYVGSWPVSDIQLPPGNVAVVDCTCEFPKMHKEDNYLCLKVWDSHGPTKEQLKIGVNWATSNRDKGRAVYIHCAHGHGRSVALIIACLIKLGVYKTIEEAESKIKTIRPKIRLNKRQRDEIIKWLDSEGIQKQD